MPGDGVELVRVAVGILNGQRYGLAIRCGWRYRFKCSRIFRRNLSFGIIRKAEDNDCRQHQG